jgi:hypothetical protein
MPQPRDIRTVVAPPGSETAVVQAFVRGDATSLSAAASLAALELELTPAVEALEARGLLYCTPTGGGWYLDVRRYTERQRRRHALEIGVIAGVAALLAWLLAQAL